MTQNIRPVCILTCNRKGAYISGRSGTKYYQECIYDTGLSVVITIGTVCVLRTDCRKANKHDKTHTKYQNYCTTSIVRTACTMLTTSILYIVRTPACTWLYRMANKRSINNTLDTNKPPAIYVTLPFSSFSSSSSSWTLVDKLLLVLLRGLRLWAVLWHCCCCCFWCCGTITQ